ncbi:MAG: hypothetical protein HC803_08715 [Saprospiraceae bacterium]|nr:hypothetical protein [Saprospiraceae bacterium]
MGVLGRIIVETSTLYSSTHVGFMVNVLDIDFSINNISKIMPLGTDSRIGLNGSDIISNLKERLNKNLYAKTIDDNGTPLKVFQFFSRSQLSEYEDNNLLFGLVMTKGEYEDQIVPAALALDTSLHDTYVNLGNIVVEGDTEMF